MVFRFDHPLSFSKNLHKKKSESTPIGRGKQKANSRMILINIITYLLLKMKQKLIVTLWRGQVDSAKSYESVYCRLAYNKQEQKSKSIETTKSLTWKQTFIFGLGGENMPLRLDFINMQEIKQIHFAKDQVLDSLSIGKSEVSIDLDNSNRGTVPSKLPIFNYYGETVGTIFLEYEILKTEVTYVVQKLMDYEYSIKMRAFKITFLRPLSTVPSFYLKFNYGAKGHKQDFSFEEQDGAFFYNYPVKFFMKAETEIEIEVQVKENYKKDYRNPNASFDTESVYSNNKSISKRGSKKNSLDLGSIQKLHSILDLDFKKDGTFNKKIPLNMVIKNAEREVGSLQFIAEIVFKTKKQKEEYEIQMKREIQLKNNPVAAQANPKKKQKKYEIPKNGSIVVNSIIGKLELFNDDVVNGKDASIELRLGKISQNSVILEDPGKQIIWMDAFSFKRTWEETIKFTVFMHTGNLKMPKFYGEVNLRDLFETGRYMGKKIELKDENNNYCGNLVVDIVYKQEEEKPRQVSIKKNPEIPPEQKLEQQKQLKKQKILQRMQKRDERKKKEKEFDLKSVVPTLSQKQLLLPPLRSSRRSLNKATLSPQNSHNMSVNIYNHGGSRVFNKASRFGSDKKDYDGDSFFYQAQSDFQKKQKRGASIGIGNKYDFTKQFENAPGVGRYQIPTVWDKYR